MLHYLNGNQSTGNSPNENYARELMELFTMGIQDAKGNDNYSQNDVHQGALALAGWVEKDGKSQFVPNRAYKGQVTYLGHTGVLEMKDVIQIVCAHPSTGRHLAYRMWSFFVYENPSTATCSRCRRLLQEQSQHRRDGEGDVHLACVLQRQGVEGAHQEPGRVRGGAVRGLVWRPTARRCLRASPMARRSTIRRTSRGGTVKE